MTTASYNHAHTYTDTQDTSAIQSTHYSSKKLFELSDVKKKDEIVICSIAALF